MIYTTAPDLLAAIKGASAKIPTSATLAICGCVRITPDAVTATDLDLYATQKLNGTGEGTFVLPTKALKELLKTLKGPITLVAGKKDGQVVLTAESGAFTLESAPLEDWPGTNLDGFKHDGSGIAITLDADSFSNLLRRALASASRDQSRPVLCSISVTQHANGVTVASTDSYRLYQLSYGDCTQSPEDRAVNVPGSLAAAIVERAGKLQPEFVTLTSGAVKGSSGRLVATVGDWTCSSRVVEGQFPNFWSLFPDGYEATVTLQVASVLTAIKSAEPFLKGSTCPLCLSTGPEGSKLTANVPDKGEFEAPIEGIFAPSGESEIAREGCKIGFNAGFLAEMIRDAHSEFPQLHLISPLRPAVITDEPCDEDPIRFRALLMPIRLN